MATCPLRIEEHCGINRRCGAEMNIDWGGYGKNCLLRLVSQVSEICESRGRPRFTKEVEMTLS